MRLCSIASGSSGNCIYVGSEATHLLVDVGISGKKAEAGLNSLGLTGRDLDGILVTHEHMDHVAGLGVMARKYEVPIYATTGTLEEIQKMGNLGKIDPALFREVKEDVKLTIKDLTVNPMKISHDAAQPVGYRIAYGDKKVGICTDLGVYNDYTVECLKGMDAGQERRLVRQYLQGKIPEEILADEFHKGRQGVGSEELLALQWERICEELSGIPGETMSGENGHSKADMVRGFYVGLAQEYRRRFEV